MNRIYRLVWNRNRHVWMAVAENSKGRSKPGLSRKLILGVLALVGGALLAPSAIAAPVGGQISAGIGNIAQAGATTTITQGSQNLAINWQSFGVAANEAVRFNQPNASAIALNRVIGQDPSQILGSLSANGQVFVLNPNGVLFGATAQVNVGGLVASTLSISDADFMAGKRSFDNDGAAGSVLNRGTLTAANGGYIALLAPEVRNEGVISATLGTALLAAGDKVTLTLNNGSLLAYSIDRGALNALADNKQLIQADGGQVFMSARAANALGTAMVNNTGIIEARTVQEVAGVIKLMGDMQVGSVNVGGTLDASAPNGGDGGFIETSAAHVKVAEDAKITTAAAKGMSGTWLVDPVDFTIAATGGNITGATLSTNLANNAVVSILSSNGITGTAGDVNVNDVVAWSANQLVLNAQNNININANLNASGSASLALIYGQGAVAAGNISNIITAHGAAVNLPAGTNSFTTLQGSDGVVKNYTVITSLGAAIDATGGAATLQGMAATANLAGYYVLGSDINAADTSAWNSNAGFAPIGDGSGGPGATSAFTGTFDGLGHTISNLTINRPTIELVGLFGLTGAGSAIRNVGLVGGSVSGMGFLGALVGSNTGTVSNSYATGSVNGSNNYVGGLVGNNQGTVSNSYATGSVSGGGSVGGLVGHNGGTVSTSYAAGSVIGSGYSVGGLVGSNYGMVSSSYATTGSVSGTNEVGGLVGNNSNGGTVSSSYATGGVSGSGEFVGGLVGSNGSTVGTSYATGDVSGTNYVGGLTGGNGGTVSNSYATGSVSWNGAICCGGTGPDRGGEAFGGLVGYNYGTVSNSYATGGVGGTSYVGGLVGLNEDTVSNSHATGDVNGGNGSSYIGGLMGYNITVSNSYATGNVVSGNGSSYVGGLVGNNGDTVSNSYATGSVMTGSSSNYVGGLAGNNDNTTISNSYATGNVTSGAGSSYVGGLAGKNSFDFNGAAGGWIINSYATGGVTGGTGSSYVGGLAGSNGTVSNISNSFWDTQTTGQSIGIGVGTTTGATGRTSAEMMLMSTFGNAGWNIANSGGSGAVWRIYEGSTTPWLVWWLKPVTVRLNSDTKIYSGTPYSGGSGYAVGNPDPALSGSVGSPNPVLSGTLAYGGTSQSAVNAGSYTIGASGLYSVQQGYDISYVDGALTITKAPLTVTADDKTRLYGAANPALTSTVSGFVNGESAGTAAGYSGTASVTSLASATTPVGSAAITAGAGSLAATNYAFTTSVDGTLTITPAPGIIIPAAEIITLPVGGILPAVVAAINALPGGAGLLPAFSSTVTVAASLVDANVPPVAFSNLQYVYLKATPGTTSTTIVSAADAATEPAKAQGAQSDGFNERLVDSPIQFSGTVLVRNGGITLPRGVKESD